MRVANVVDVLIEHLKASIGGQFCQNSNQSLCSKKSATNNNDQKSLIEETWLQVLF